MDCKPYHLINRAERMALRRAQQHIIHQAALDNISLPLIQMNKVQNDEKLVHRNIETIEDVLDTVDLTEFNQQPEILPTTIIDGDFVSTSCPIVDDDAISENEYDANISDETNYKNFFFDSETPLLSPSSTELAVLLSYFRHRHKITKSCLTDLCKLLRRLGIKNAPVDCRAIGKILAKDEESSVTGKMFMICSKCYTKGTNPDKCENKACTDYQHFSITPTSLITFKLLPQITSILERQPVDAFISSSSNQLTDITNTSAYKSLMMTERAIEKNRQIITLLLNTDGILVKQINRSIWISCVVINELPRRVRFKQENMVICSVSLGEQKPKKEAFQLMIRDWVNELVQLEHGFYISPPHLRKQLIKVHAYLLAGTMDKPALALLSNLNDPTGFYSCSHCKSVPTRNGTVRTFIRQKSEIIHLRDNDLYDIHIKNLSDRHYSKAVPRENDLSCGQMGSCSLRQLKYFQIGKSFCSDSLHNIYSGVFRRLLTCWFKSRGKIYSIHKSLFSIEKILDSMKFPSTTYRIPSRLRHWSTFKANEYRITLLFGYMYVDLFFYIVEENPY
ncbi:unnamed protein product [Rotaria sp. Silwood2]|nr:unnamed protein product [Rotaria sp. Silwood2]CAF2936854.1 unnamed protein product [Rotaria sp. Silwood2]CAF3314152.1 unnamed protein product [Rotaria sp. Silwood2]